MTAINLADTYLGNLTTDLNLQNQVALSRTAGCCLEVALTHADRKKARIHAVSQCGAAVGIIKKRDWLLTEGDVFETEQKQLVIVHLEVQKLMVLSVSKDQSGQALALIHLGHTLGNQHYPILVSQDKIYIQLTSDHARIEAMIHSFAILGLTVSYETRSPEQQLDFATAASHSSMQSSSHSHH
ncbi:MAG: urease accessory protein UreE [Cyanobacteria bacterium P01_F01_bin.86]